LLVPVTRLHRIGWTVITLLAFGCGPKRVLIDGREMDPDEGSRYLYEQGHNAQQAGDFATAKQRYRDLVDQFKEAPEVPDALAELGKIGLDEGGCAAGAYHLERLVKEFPAHPRAVAAKKILESCGGTMAAKNSELSQYESKFVQAGSDSERKEAASKAADAAEGAGDYAAAVRWLLKVLALEESDAQKRALEGEISELIDRRLSFQDVRAILEETKGDAFPKAVLTYKLGRIQYHVRDLSNAKATLEEFLSKWATSPYAEGAKHLLELINARSKVNPTTIGVLVPTSGKLKAYGDNVLQAVRLAAGELDGKKGPPPINIVVRDSKGDAAEAAKAIQDFVMVDGAIAVVGALFRVEAEGAAYKAQELGVPLITLTAEEGITDIGPYVLRAGVTNAAQMDALVSYVMDVLGMKRFAILYPRHPYGEELVHLFWDRVESRKGEIRGVQSYASTETTFTDAVKSLVGRDALELRADYHAALKECAKQPDTFRKSRCERNVATDLKPIIDFDGLFIPDYPATLALIAPALAVEDIIVEQDQRYLKKIEKTLDRKVTPVTLLGASGWNSPKLPEKAGRYVENALFTDGFFPGAEDKATSTFVSEFRKHFQRQPALPEALFYDAVSMAKNAIQSAAPDNREAMRLALRAVHDFPGVTGKVSFREGGEVKRDVKILTIKNGDIEQAALPSEKAPTVRETSGRQ
jgi:branched-chain amino acid transport system substrate-binding protein